jgi:ankyrin repeat protein
MIKRFLIINRAAVLCGLAGLFLLPALLSAQAAPLKPPEKPPVVDMGTYKVCAPPGRGWQIDVDKESGEVVFVKLKEGFIPGQVRNAAVSVKSVILNIYGWRSTEEEVIDDILLNHAAIEFPSKSKIDRDVAEWGGKKLYTIRGKYRSGGAKSDAIIFLYFPPDVAKSHRYFEFGLGYTGVMVKMQQDPALEPVQAVIDSLEIVDPLQAIPGPHGDLVRAAAAGDAEGVVQALEKGAAINAARPERGALSAAAFYGHKEVVDLLLEKGARVDTPDATGGATPLLAATIGREPEIAIQLIGKGANVNRKANAGGGRGVSPLMLAVAIGHLDLARAIIDAGADLKSRTELGESALVLAADNGWVEGAALLLERGADANARMSNGWTALMRAADKGHFEVVGMLLKNKADPNLKATDGEWSGWTAMMLAVRQGQVDIVRTIIDNGAEVNTLVAGSDGSPLHGAVVQGMLEIAKILIEAGAEVNVKTEGGVTPLMGAVMIGETDIVKLLIEKGADVNARTIKGQTALQIAKKEKNAEIIKLLQAAGAR